MRDERATLILPDRIHDGRCRICGACFEAAARFCGDCGHRIVLPRPSLVGATLDGLYAVEDKLHDGRHTTIYRAHYLPTDTPVALEVMHAELVDDAVAVRRFERKHRRLLRMRCPALVAVLDVGRTADGIPYLAMELLDGRPLALCPTLSQHHALPILRAVCRALDTAHRHGIIHGNLDRGNIFVGRDGSVKLLGFACDEARSNRRADFAALGRVARALISRPSPAVRQLMERCIRNEIHEARELVTELARLAPTVPATHADPAFVDPLAHPSQPNSRKPTMRQSRIIQALLLLIVAATVAACLTDGSDIVDDDHNLAVAPTPPPHPPKPPHPPIYPNEPCEACHASYPRPGKPPPIPGQCLACHAPRPRPNDPHWPNYPEGKKKLPPGDIPLEPFCLRCHGDDAEEEEEDPPTTPPTTSPTQETTAL